MATTHNRLFTFKGVIRTVEAVEKVDCEREATGAAGKAAQAEEATVRAAIAPNLAKDGGISVQTSAKHTNSEYYYEREREREAQSGRR